MWMDMRGKTVIVTGANAGIGKATAAQLADLGAHVVLACRSEARGQAALEALSAVPARRLTLMRLDLADLGSVRRFAADYAARFPRLDVLVNNAGMLGRKRAVTGDGFELQLQTNYLGHFLLTTLLFPLLDAAPQGRVITLSSVAHRWTHVHFDDMQLANGYDRMLAYGQSKLCNLLICRALAEKWREAGSRVTINAANPGIVASDIVIDRRSGALRWIAVLSRAVLLSPAQGAKTSVFLAADDSLSAVSGAYFVRRHPVSGSRVSRDMAAAARLYELSMNLLSLTSFSGEKM